MSDYKYQEWVSKVKLFFGKSSTVPTESDVRVFINLYRQSNDLDEITDEDVEVILKMTLESMKFKLGGTFTIRDLKSGNWHTARKDETEWRFWNRYYDYICMKHNQIIAKQLDDITDEIMDGCADPRGSPASTKGMVVGDVQSGKTNNFIGLANKAADVGYKVIVILSGITTALRKQTQGRIDEGLVGVTWGPNGDLVVGVGELDDLRPISLTKEHDFKSENAGSIIQLKSVSSPLVLVVKKNSRILKNLYDWLKDNNSGQSGKIDGSIFIIDDEADNASVNVSKTSISAINNGIRSLLNLFTISSYVGYTATPFANVFIDPDATGDLFPRNFIQLLGHGNDYIGGEELFTEDGKYSWQLRPLPDELPEIPWNHKKEDFIQSLPPQLEYAIHCFFLTCAIRDLRGDYREHMSMMINVSRYTLIQENLCHELIEPEINRIVETINTYCGLDPEVALNNTLIKTIYEVFELEYGSKSKHKCEFEWPQIQKQLISSSKKIEVGTVNQVSGVSKLRYKDSPNGQRIIAIGGYSLSRGITLEGLVISFFYRRSKTYDALLQMARWFGYRRKYDDLCRIWMTPESIGWYQKVVESVEELKWEFKVMKENGKTPEEFGFRVRDDILGMYVTSTQKLKNANKKPFVKNISGQAIETTSVYIDPQKVRNNNNSIISLVNTMDNLPDVKYVENKHTNNYVWLKVPRKIIWEFTTSFDTPPINASYIPAVYDTLLSKDIEQLNYWDVAIVSQKKESGKTVSVGGRKIHPSLRTTFNDMDSKHNIITFNNYRLMSKTDTREGLFNEQGEYDVSWRDRLKENWENMGRKISDHTYLNDRNRRPLLLIYYLDLIGDKPENDLQEWIQSALKGECPVGLALCFPAESPITTQPSIMERVSRSKNGMIITYLTNSIYKANDGNTYIDDFDDDDGEEEDDDE